MKKVKYPKCAVCGKVMKEGYLFAYVINGKQRKNGIKVCSYKCQMKLD